MKIHFIGIGGISMSALAAILSARNHSVTGSDICETDITASLMEKGINVHIGHKALDLSGYDAVVYTQAVSKDNPEILSAERARVPLLERADLLGLLAREYRETIAISGSHGKTTASCMLASCMLKLDPTVHIGGSSAVLNGCYRTGGDNFFLTEACEYKRSFLHLKPKTAIVLNIDADHLDYYKDIDDIALAFKEFLDGVPKNDGLIVFHSQDSRAKALARAHGAQAIALDFNPSQSQEKVNYSSIGKPFFRLSASNVSPDSLGRWSFDVFGEVPLANSSKTKRINPTAINLGISGRHNIINAMSAISVSLYYGADIEDIRSALKDFRGAQRRWQRLGACNGAKVIADYAHHPKELSATLEMARELKPKRLLTVFQPHTFTRTQKLWEDFKQVLKDGGTTILTPIYPARERPINGISSNRLAKELRELNPESYFVPDFHSLADLLKNRAQAGDLILLLGAGDIINAGALIIDEQNT